MTAPGRPRPLVEALVEVHWGLQPGPGGGQIDPSYPLFVGGFFQRCKGAFPFQERLPAADIPDEMTPHVVKYRFRPGPEQWPILQVGPGVASLNFVSSYSWSDLHELASKSRVWLTETLPEAANSEEDEPRFTQFSIRYINAFPLPESESVGRFVSEKLQTTVDLPRAVLDMAAGPALGLNLNAILPLDREGSTGQISIFNGERDGHAAVICDLSVHEMTGAERERLSDFDEWLEYAHGVAEEWFFSLVPVEEQGRLGIYRGARQ